MSKHRTPRTTLEAIRADRGLTWGEVARAIRVDGGYTISEAHVRRLGTAALDSTPAPGLARAMERVFQQPVEVLLGPPDPGAMMPAPGLPTDMEALEMATEKMRRLGLNLTPLEDYRLLDDEVRDLARAYPVQALPELINPMITLQEIVTDAITSPTRPGDGQRLYGIAAITGGLLAKASHDLGNARSAGTQARTALIFADQLGDPAVTAWLNGLLSLISYWDNRSRESLDYAKRGLAASSSTSASLWLHASAARAWGRLGNADEATAAVHAAETVVEHLERSDLDDYGGILTFTPERAAYYAADTYAWLPEHPEAERVASAAVEAFSDPSQESWAFGDAAGAACDLAIVRIHRGELEGAQEALAGVLDLPREQRIGGIIKSVQHVSTALAPAPPSGIRDQLAEQLEAFTRAPMVLQP
ncbi:XRE family transcriptional regulator [Nocardioides sp. NPDC087217]|uniref:XRE family transcriptional regulator n=1 Tax=Nocardioides sp. NPDC087217 TaxID=3364335 RepID=UPI0038013E4D